MPEIDLGVAHLRLYDPKNHFVVIHDFGGPFENAKGIVHIGEHTLHLRVAADDSINIDELVLVAHFPTMLNWAQHINLVDSRPSEPQLVLNLNRLEDTGERYRRLQNLYELVVWVMLTEGMVSARHHIGDAEVEVSLGLFISEEVFDEGIEVAGIVHAVLIEEPVNHTPAPRLDKLAVLFSNEFPELNHFICRILFLPNGVQAHNVGIKCANTYSRNHLVFLIAISQ